MDCSGLSNPIGMVLREKRGMSHRARLYETADCARAFSEMEKQSAGRNPEKGHDKQKH